MVEPEAGEVRPGVEDRLLDTFKKGTFSLNARLRWEHADQTGLAASDAVTLRTRFGFTTAPLHGFQGMIEGENIVSLGAPYNPAGLKPWRTDRTVIADPEITEVNQAWVSYSRWDSTVRGGRQRIVLDNHRFVGDVGWRQNMQTFDGAALRIEALERTSLFYGYLSQINRVLGADHPAGQYDSDSHLIHLSYEAAPAARFAGYACLLDFDNAPADSSHTFGGSLTGTFNPFENWTLGYRAEAAWQTDAGPNPTDYDAVYYHAELEARHRGIRLGVGYETLGSDRGTFGFRTPLATLHRFNGWADSFLTTPAQGLRDFYALFEVPLPGDIPLQFVYHRFWSDHGGLDFGQEFDAMVSRKIGRSFTALAKVAYHEGSELHPDLFRFWLQAEFNY